MLHIKQAYHPALSLGGLLFFWVSNPEVFQLLSTINKYNKYHVEQWTSTIWFSKCNFFWGKIFLGTKKFLENLLEQFLRKFPKTVILGQDGHFLAHLAKIGQNENFNKKSGRAIFLPLLSPNFIPSFRKIVGAVSEINSLWTNAN